METPDITELAEIQDLRTANDRLKQNWVFIRCLATLKKVDDGKWSEMPLYILGKPKILNS